MSSFTTLLRAAVMLAAAIVIVKGWERFGPSAQQMKTWTAQIVERAHDALGERPQLAPAAGDSLSAGSVAEQLPAALPSIVSAAPSRLEESEFPAVPPIHTNSALAAGPAASQRSESPPHADEKMESERMPRLLARLEQLGGVDPQLVAWGKSGQLYRFCCRAALADTPQHARHFESVAAEPLVAVEEVVAKVEAWRSEQQTLSGLY